MERLGPDAFGRYRVLISLGDYVLYRGRPRTMRCIVAGIMAALLFGALPDGAAPVTAIRFGQLWDGARTIVQTGEPNPKTLGINQLWRRPM
jgi:hypothetical protein